MAEIVWPAKIMIGDVEYEHRCNPPEVGKKRAGTKWTCPCGMVWTVFKSAQTKWHFGEKGWTCTIDNVKARHNVSKTTKRKRT